MKRIQLPFTGHPIAFSRLAIGLLLLVLFIINVIGSRKMSLTYDELVHYQYGAQMLSLNSDRLPASEGRIDDSKMPITALNALTSKLTQLLSPGASATEQDQVSAGRLATILFSMLIAWLVYHWSKSLYGLLPGLFSLFLFVFEPNIIAHSQLVTTDIYAMGMVTVTTYALWRYSREASWKTALVFATTLGLSQLAKYTCIFLYPVMAVILLVKELPGLLQLASTRNFHGLYVVARRLVLLACLVVIVSLLVINAGYFFNRTFTRFGDYQFKSNVFISMRYRLPFLKNAPVPLPYPYLQGLDLVMYRERTGHGRGLNYLLGQLSKQGFPGYYLVAWLVKVPLAIQVIFLLSILVYFTRFKVRRFFENEWFLFAPILIFTVYLDLFNRAQIGIRYLLIVFPLILIFCGNLMTGWQTFRRIRWAAVGALAAFLVISVLGNFPNYIPYFNELITDRRMAYKVLADSNLDWGQAQGNLKAYLDTHSGVQFNPPGPVTGTVVVGPNELVGVTTDPAAFLWLRQSYRPVGTIANTYLIFDVPGP